MYLNLGTAFYHYGFHCITKIIEDSMFYYCAYYKIKEMFLKLFVFISIIFYRKYLSLFYSYYKYSLHWNIWLI